MPESLTILALLGASVGSFVNVCIHRIPRNVSVLSIRSACPECRSALRWYELVPIVSFVALHGRCRICGWQLPLVYPVVELLGAVLTVALFLMFGFTEKFLTASAFLFLMLPIAVIDWRHLIVSNKILTAGYVAGVGLLLAFRPEALSPSIMWALAAAIGMFLIGALGTKMADRPAMGMGDVKLSALVVLFLGIEGFLVSLWMASVFGTVCGLASKRKRGGGKIPFGSFLAATSSLVLVFGDSVMEIVSTWMASRP